VRRWIAALIFLPACGVDADIARVPAPVVFDAGPEVDSGAFTCPSGMIHLGTFCVDATEVTRAQYAAFLAAKPTGSTDPRCAWNSEFAPRVLDEDPAYCSADEADLTKNPDHPVVCIDWCDALAYCDWAGKRLCGAIGGGPEPFRETMNNVAKSQWFAACAGGGERPRVYPYGDTWEAGTCVDLTVGSAQKVGSKPNCHGPIGTPQAAVFDMSGNVYEWTDNCQTSVGDESNRSCVARGGFYRNEDSNEAGVYGWMRCTAIDPFTLTKPRNQFDDHIGFRCCSP